jgi:hypothetical protein
MNPQEEEEQRQASAHGQSCDPLDQIMLSPVVSSVNPFHLADLATLRETDL